MKEKKGDSGHEGGAEGEKTRERGQRKYDRKGIRKGIRLDACRRNRAQTERCINQKPSGERRGKENGVRWVKMPLSVIL